MNEEDIKNKDILQEINNEQDDLDEYSIGLLDDGKYNLEKIFKM